MNTVSTFKSDITPKLHGSSLGKIAGFEAKMREASSNMKANVKPSTIIRRSRIDNAIYDKVYNYSCPTWLEKDNIIDLRPIGERSTQDSIGGAFSRRFDIKKKEDTILIEYINGVKTLRLSKDVGSVTTLHRVDSLTLDGAITLSGDASNPTIDTLDYVSGSGSMKFDLDGVTGQAIVTIALTNKIDLSDMKNLGSVFDWIKFSDATRLTNVNLKWGSSSTDFWDKTVTSAQDRAFESDAWMLLLNSWTTANTTGTPDATVINYLQITINYTPGTAMSGIGLDNITASLGKAYEIVGYSNSFFTDSTGVTWKETPTSGSDLIQLDSDGYNIFMYEFMLTLQQELKGKNMTTDFQFFKDKLGDVEKGTGLYGKYIQKNPDESLIRTIKYYEF